MLGAYIDVNLTRSIYQPLDTELLLRLDLLGRRITFSRLFAAGVAVKPSNKGTALGVLLQCAVSANA